ncbi:MAG: MarR family winged helix-turn-helix transcriptional regulator [Chloroflexota bacterium]
MSDGFEQWESAWDSPGFLLWHVALRWQAAMREALSPHGLTHVQFVLLASIGWLAERGDPPLQRAVAEHAGADVAMTSQVVRSLEAKGLVARERGAGDARSWRLTLTAAGGERLGAALASVEAADRSFFEAAPDPASMPAVLRALARRDRSGTKLEP